MPYFSIETNQTVNPEELTKKSTTFIAGLLGKPEGFVMIALKPATAMSFGGSTESSAFIQLSSIGLPTDRCTEFSQSICEFIENELEVPKDRVFIDFKNLKRNLFGWNGKTF
jgi:hypothetical protein